MLFSTHDEREYVQAKNETILTPGKTISRVSLESARVIACTRPSRVSRCTAWAIQPHDAPERRTDPLLGGDRRSRKTYFRFSNKSQFERMRAHNRAFHLPKQFHNDA